MKRLLLFLLLASPCLGQTHTFPALDTNNAFTGNNTHSGTETFTGLANLNGGGSLIGNWTGGPTCAIANSPTGLTESGLTATMTTVAACALNVGDSFTISGAGLANYTNAPYPVTNSLGGPNPPMWIVETVSGGNTVFTFQATVSGTAGSGGGNASGSPRMTGGFTIPAGSTSNQHVIIAAGDFFNHDTFNYSALHICPSGATSCLPGGLFDFSTEINLTQGSNPMMIGHAVGVSVPSTATNFYIAAMAPFINCAAAVACAAEYGQARALVNSAKVWAHNPQVQDIVGLTNVSMLGSECDSTPLNAPASYLGIACFYAVLGSGSHAGNYGFAFNIGVNSPAFGNTFWGVGYRCGPGVTITCIELGKATGAFGGTVVSNSTPINAITNSGAGDLTSFIQSRQGLGWLLNYVGVNQFLLGNAVTISANMCYGIGTVNDVTAATIDVALCRSSANNFEISTNAFTPNSNGGLTAAALTVTQGVKQGGGFKHQRFGAQCTTAASVGGLCATPTTNTWTAAFADANYTVVCTLNGITSGVPVVEGYTAKIAASFTINFAALTAVAAQASGLDCIAAHD